MENLDWREEGVCYGLDNSHLFFPRDRRELDIALGYCSGCPVRVECFVFGSSLYMGVGVWGGRLLGGYVVDGCSGSGPGSG